MSNGLHVISYNEYKTEVHARRNIISRSRKIYTYSFHILPNTFTTVTRTPTRTFFNTGTGTTA
jgi:hypothetical protein